MAVVDHLAVTSSGVYVIDSTKYKDRARLRVEGGLLRPRVERWVVGTRDCTKVDEGARAMVGDDVPVHGVLRFVEADWPLIGGYFTARGVDALWPKRLYPKLESSGPLSIDTVARLPGCTARSPPPPSA